MSIVRGAPVLFLLIAILIASALPAQSPFETIPAALSDTLAFRTPLNDFEAGDLAGKTWGLADLRGRVTVVSIWSTWCLPCRKEAPAIQALSEAARANDKIQVLTFSLDRDPEAVRSYIEERGYTFPVIVDPELAGRLFPAGGIPNSWVIDRQGRRSDAFRAWTFGRIVLEAEKLARRPG